MRRRPASGGARGLADFAALPAVVIVLAACAPAASPATPTAIATPEATAALPTATPSETPPATELPTAPPEPTATPVPADLPISPETLAQLRALWSIEEAGNPLAESGCQDVACWMASRLGGHALSPDGSKAAVGVCTVDSTENTTNPRHYRFNCDGPAEVRLYDAASGELLQSFAVDDFPLSLAFHPDGTILAAGMAHRSIEVWDLAAGEKIQTLLHSTTRTGVDDLAFSPDGELLVSSGDSRLQLWQWERGLPAGIIENVSDFSMNPTGGSLVTLFWSSDGSHAEARVYPFDDLDAFRAFRLDWQPGPRRILYSPDGSRLIALGSYGLEILDAASGESLRQAVPEDLLEPGGQQGLVSVVDVLTGDGRLLILASVDDSAGGFTGGPGLWDPMTDGADVALLPFDFEESVSNLAWVYNVTGMTLDPADLRLAVQEVDGRLTLWGVDPAAPPEGVVCLGTCEP